MFLIFILFLGKKMDFIGLRPETMGVYKCLCYVYYVFIGSVLYGSSIDFAFDELLI